MAQLNLKLRANAPGDLFVDETCIDCDTCRQIAPGVFVEGKGTSYVARQPRDEAEHRRALMALVSCPTASIGSADKPGSAAAARDFPEPVDGPVHYCGSAIRSSSVRLVQTAATARAMPGRKSARAMRGVL